VPAAYIGLAVRTLD